MVGSQWAYRGSSPSSAYTVEVTGTRISGDLEYYVVTGWPGRGGETLLRKDDLGRIWELRSGAKETLFLNGNAGKGEDAGNAGDDCNGAGEVVSKSTRVTSEIGEYNNALKVRFNQGPCADAGVESDYWLPWVGLLKRTFQTIAGPRSYDLVYARLGDVTVITTPEHSFSVSTSKAVYIPADVLPAVIGAEPVLNVRIALRNSTGIVTTLEFPSGQDYDVTLKNSQGEVIWRWSDGKAFTEAYRAEKLAGERNWLVQVPLTAKDGTALKPGTYTVEAELATKGRPYKASVPLEVVRAF